MKKIQLTHKEQLIWLIEYLLKEQEDYQGIKIPADEQKQKNILRSLMNVRLPEPTSEEFLAIQDEYLKTEIEAEGIVDVNELSAISETELLFLWQGDITRLKADGIVNAANSQMLGCFHPLHACIDNVIGSKAGVELRLYMKQLMDQQGHEEPTGQAKLSPGFNLPSKFIIHTVGPIVRGKLTKKNETDLASSYRSCLELAAENGLKSLVFCCISTGVFGFPQERAAEIAVDTTRKFLRESGVTMKVVFNVFKDEDYQIYQGLLQE